ncbi:GTP pyrophosphokinase [Chlorobium phaeobacteroides]|uniref:RelA/SpoT domain protein n=1 Tax=Chlorobium phaeobacteroides (strain DSM 266 / SMG 266 / 2430) TaxID=290317 RepID=A1BI43_CHLPD|nr:RelA/SpoT domain-containing protein [Chlorobium phaeobacteroides]ABL66070.1 RelA/SpoT domain protein [Chlorobium phaeobacteroides DSM 266]
MKSKVSFEDACLHLKSIAGPTKMQLLALEDNCLNNNAVSKIYLTKYRIKKQESVYLKTKRKNKSLDEINDYGGLRLLCLFEDDIFDVHNDFVRMLHAKHYELKCCSAYNWNVKSIDKLRGEIDRYFDKNKYVFEKIKKTSGYKSVHYVVKQSGLDAEWIEVQLRTLVQDVWGELEHSISYKKGGIHPHIKKSFSLLSKELINIESLLSYLKEVNQKEIAGEEYYNKLVTPKYVFKYESQILPPCFEINVNLKVCYKQYWEIIESFETTSISHNWINQARAKLTEFNRNLTIDQLDENPELEYWIKMENAFLLFCDLKHEDSLKEYEKLLTKFGNRYCVHFRAGELYFILGHIEKALSSFDKAEDLIVVTEEIDHVNHYRIKTRLAYYYWSLGEEYIDISITEIKEAEEIFSKNKQLFDEAQYEQLVNNICWYKLEKYIIAVKKAESEETEENIRNADLAFEDVSSSYVVIDTLLKTNYISSHLLDTAAWYCYWVYKKTNDRAYLSKARDYALSINEKVKLTSYPFKSMKTHMNHIQAIMSAK